MNRIANILFVLILCQGAFAKDEKHHHEHGKHQHGHADLSIAFEKEKGRIDFRSPSDSVVGFEHAAKTDKEKKQLNDTLALIETKMNEMVQMDPTLQCTFKKDKLEVQQDGSHSETVASFSVHCAKSPLGTKLNFQIQKFFKKLTDVDVQVLVDSVQKSIEANQVGVSLELK